MAKVLPTRTFGLPGFGSREFSLNPGPFNVKEHVLISIFANAGAGFGGGAAYAVSIVDIIRAFYHRKISFLASWILLIATRVNPFLSLQGLLQYVLGYWWAGILRKALHEKDREGFSRGKFFMIALASHVTAQQLGSGMRRLGLASFTLDWSVIASFMGSPLLTPFYAIANTFVGYVIIIYGLTPLAYWGVNLYQAKNFPIFSSHLFNSLGQVYNVSAIVNDKFEIDMPAYEKQGHIYLSTFFVITYGCGFAAVVATLTHVAMFNGRSDPNAVVGSPLRPGLALIFTLPISIITATTIVTPGLNVITEYILGIIYPGRPIANVCFKTYGYISMTQAVSFLNDFKLGHYMKIPPRSMFIVQLIGTVIAGTINVSIAWYLLTTVKNICQDELLPPNSPWTCPGDRVFFDASVIWGLVGPKRIFGSLGNYGALNWFFLGGAIGPVVVWILHKAFPKQEWIKLINLPVILGATAMMPPATTLNFNSWIFVGTIFGFFIFRYRKWWWQRYNYVLSAALDAGVAFMGVLLYFSLGMEEISISWWGSAREHCPLASCSTAPGIAPADGCPVPRA
ncbi:hypothetical protein RJ639_005673 [Escallonia herrerae]|uniref:Oligopeptide transporter n=1 Tax=Escallonia herrerae TaxID=1293975 RepID=A0AA89AVK0_9ASTE|nr:hypothetical protein RJ639_005673 [Escallonia herrerae]